MVPALAVWAVGKMLESPRVKARLAIVDDRLFLARHRAVKKATKHRAWLAAGATACAVGIGMLATAAKK